MQSRAPEWIDRFAIELGRLGTHAEPALLADFGFEMWKTDGGRPPDELARAGFDTWPPHDD
jgi:hypothetical protein